MRFMGTIISMRSAMLKYAAFKKTGYREIICNGTLSGRRERFRLWEMDLLDQLGKSCERY